MYSLLEKANEVLEKILESYDISSEFFLIDDDLQNVEIDMVSFDVFNCEKGIVINNRYYISFAELRDIKEQFKQKMNSLS